MVEIDPAVHAAALAAARVSVAATSCDCYPVFDVQVHTGTGELRVLIDHLYGCKADR